MHDHLFHHMPTESLIWDISREVQSNWITLAPKQQQHTKTLILLHGRNIKSDYMANIVLSDLGVAGGNFKIVIPQGPSENGVPYMATGDNKIMS